MDNQNLSTGLDWYTATTKEERVGVQWYEKFRQHVREVGSYELDEWRNRWYVGQQAAGLRWGYSDRQGYIFIASGGIAGDTWLSVLPSASNVSRIDLQATVLLGEPSAMADQHYSQSKDDKKRTYSLISNSLGGSTLYVGSRSSDQFGRVYDKGIKAKSHEKGLLWRYEVEIKKPRATVLAKQLYERWKRGEDVYRGVLGYVYTWFRSRSVYPVFSPTNDYFLVEVEKTVTTADKQLRWLRTQVAPTVARLMDAGYTEQVVDALGVDARQLEMFSGGDKKNGL